MPGLRATLLGGVLGSAIAAAGMAGDAASPALPVLDVEPVEGGYRIAGRVVGLASGEVEAQLSLERTDSSGRTATRQSRSIAVEPGSETVVGETQLSAGPDAELEVRLTLSAAGTPFARAEMRLARDGDFPDTTE